MLAAVAVLLGPSVTLLGALAHGNLHDLRAQLAAKGAWAGAALIGVALAHTVLPFPSEILAAAGGYALGFWVALPFLLAGLVASALAGYGIGAWVGRPLLARMVGTGGLDRAERWVARGGARGLLMVRLLPLVPFTPVSVACGLTAVPLRRYLWTTAVGILPEVALITFLGSRLRSMSPTDPTVLGPMAGVLVLVTLAPVILRRLRRRGTAPLLAWLS